VHGSSNLSVDQIPNYDNSSERISPIDVVYCIDNQSGLAQYFRTGVARVSTNENAECDSSIAFQNKP